MNAKSKPFALLALLAAVSFVAAMVSGQGQLARNVGVTCPRKALPVEAGVLS
jgi:hypothetical protein